MVGIFILAAGKSSNGALEKEWASVRSVLFGPSFYDDYLLLLPPELQFILIQTNQKTITSRGVRSSHVESYAGLGLGLALPQSSEHGHT